MAGTITPISIGVIGDLKYWRGTFTFDAAYLQTGESFTASNMGMSDVYKVDLKLRNGSPYDSVYYDDANGKIKLFALNLGTTTAREEADDALTGLIQDDDNAATTGVAIFLHIDSNPGVVGAALGHLEFVSPTNANGVCLVNESRAQLVIKDNDAAATNGFVVRAQAAGAGLRADLDLAVESGPIYVPLQGGGQGSGVTPNVLTGSFGQYLRVLDSDTATDPQIFFDEDATVESEKLMAVVVDNADETFPLFWAFPGEVNSGADALKCVVDVFAIGKP